MKFPTCRSHALLESDFHLRAGKAPCVYMVAWQSCAAGKWRGSEEWGIGRGLETEEWDERERNWSEEMHAEDVFGNSSEANCDFDEAAAFRQLKELAHHAWCWPESSCKCPQGHSCILKHTVTGVICTVQ